MRIGPARSLAPRSRWSLIRKSIRETREDWGHEGKKIGMLATGALAVSQAPIWLANATAVALTQLPALGAGGPVWQTLSALALYGITVAGGMAGLAVAGLEERKLGLGKRVGELAFSGPGVVAGLLKGLVGLGKSKKPGPITLPLRAPTGRRPFEPWIPRVLHRVEEKFLGRKPARSRGVEMGENLGAVLAGGAGGVLLPVVLTGTLGGPIGLVMSSLVGGLLGIVVGGVEENALGAGRALGEVVGGAVSGLRRGLRGNTKVQAVSDDSLRAARTDGRVWKTVMQGMQIIAEPIVSFLVDVTSLSNRLFAEKPVETIRFTERPEPVVSRERLLANFVRLAGIRGPSREESPVGDEIARQLRALGVRYERHHDGTLLAVIPGTVPDAPTVLLSAHQDTVAPTSAQAIRVGERKVHTDETHILGGDDRAGIAEILEGVRSVLEQDLPRPEIRLLFTVREELGLRGAGRLRPEEISPRPTLGFVMDSTRIQDVYLMNDAVFINPDSVSYRFSQEDPLIQVVFHAMARAGLKPRPIHAPIMLGAGSDANTRALNSGTIRSLAVGAGEQDLHSTLENVKIDDLEQAARHVVGFITHATDLRVEGDQILPRHPL